MFALVFHTICHARMSSSTFSLTAAVCISVKVLFADHVHASVGAQSVAVEAPVELHTVEGATPATADWRGARSDATSAQVDETVLTLTAAAEVVDGLGVGTAAAAEAGVAVEARVRRGRCGTQAWGVRS